MRSDLESSRTRCDHQVAAHTHESFRGADDSKDTPGKGGGRAGGAFGTDDGHGQARTEPGESSQEWKASESKSELATVNVFERFN